jgi:hypothetical protein
MKAAKEQVPLSKTKYHRIFGRDLRVGLEMTLPVDSRITVAGEIDLTGQPEFVSKGRNFLRVFHPAFANADMSQKDRRSGRIQFVPWVDSSQAVGYRLVLTYDPDSLTPWVRLARFDEQQVFQPGKYVNLDFLTKRATGFVTTYAKVKGMDHSKPVYLEISADANDDKSVVSVRRVAEGKVPRYLAEAAP